MSGNMKDDIEIGLKIADYLGDSSSNAERDMGVELYAALQRISENSGGPDGWQMVPIEPTIEMLDAGWKFFTESYTPRTIFMSMLESAPPAIENKGAV